MNNLTGNSSLGSQGEETQQSLKPKAINPSNMLLPSKIAANDISKWSSQSVIPWVEAIAKAVEDIDHRGPIIMGEAHLSKPSKEPYVSFAPSTTISPSLISSDPNQLRSGTTWDLSYIEDIDAFAGLFLGQIRPLAARYEELMGSNAPNAKAVDKEALHSLYMGLKDRLKHHFNQIVKKHCALPMFDDEFDLGASQTQVGDVARDDLDALYDETIDKLHSMFLRLQSKLFGDTAPNETKSVVTTSATKAPLPKNELGSYMATWLRQNFTNPYPDDDELNRMAIHCGTTTKIISNWLINARTRKWRPAIQKACNLGRPADMLLEDSINFFDGTPLRAPSGPPPSYGHGHPNGPPDHYGSPHPHNYQSYDDGESGMHDHMDAQGPNKRMRY
jgi:Homeobox KN domain